MLDSDTESNPPCFRYKEALETDEYREIDSELAHENFELFQKVVNSIDGCSSWYELSSSTHEYEECEGDRALNWKDKGYITLFDLLQVF